MMTVFAVLLLIEIALFVWFGRINKREEEEAERKLREARREWEREQDMWRRP